MLQKSSTYVNEKTLCHDPLKLWKFPIVFFEIAQLHTDEIKRKSKTTALEVEGKCE